MANLIMVTTEVRFFEDEERILWKWSCGKMDNSTRWISLKQMKDFYFLKHSCRKTNTIERLSSDPLLTVKDFILKGSLWNISLQSACLIMLGVKTWLKCADKQSRNLYSFRKWWTNNCFRFIYHQTYFVLYKRLEWTIRKYVDLGSKWKPQSITLSVRMFKYFSMHMTTHAYANTNTIFLCFKN